MDAMEERRKASRKEKKIPVYFSQSSKGGVLETETINIALNGLYCKTAKFIEPYTEVSFTLVHKTKNGGESISAEGVVVRCEPPNHDVNVKEYKIGVFFTEMNDSDKEKLSSWLSEKGKF